MKICKINDCNAPVNARGWCKKHYNRWAKTGTPDRACLGCGANVRDGRASFCGPQCKPRCAVEGCGKPIRGRTEKYCITHSTQYQKTGLPPTIKGTPWAPKGGLCTVCGDPVPEGTSNRRYCSTACRVRFHHHSGSRPQVFTCKGCGVSVSLKSRREDGKLRRSDAKWCNNCLSADKRRRVYRYGVSPELYDKALAAGCEICGKTDDKLHVDHDHDCCPGGYTCGNCIRGFICGACNRAIGLLLNDADVMLAAAAYVLKSQNMLAEINIDRGERPSRS